MHDLPAQVPWSAVNQLVCQELLGLDADRVKDITEIVILPRSIEVTQLRRNPEGQRFLSGGDVATVITKIGVIADE